LLFALCLSHVRSCCSAQSAHVVHALSSSSVPPPVLLMFFYFVCFSRCIWPSLKAGTAPLAGECLNTAPPRTPSNSTPQDGGTSRTAASRRGGEHEQPLRRTRVQARGSSGHGCATSTVLFFNPRWTYLVLIVQSDGIGVAVCMREPVSLSARYIFVTARLRAIFSECNEGYHLRAPVLSTLGGINRKASR